MSQRFLTLASACLAAALLVAAPTEARSQEILSGHVPRAVASSRPLNKLPDSTRLNLAIGLPLRNQEQLDTTLKELSDPESPRFHHYLTPAQFAEQFGPSEEDYQALIQFARENGLSVTGTHSNRVVLDVAGDVAAIEKVLHVNLMTYEHPVRGRFFAPDREPSLEPGVPVLDISGLDNFEPPHPMSLKKLSLEDAQSYVTGSGPGGYFIGKDFRAAYAPGVSLTGSGQTVGLLEFDGFYPGDVQKNATAAGLPVVPTQTVLLDGFNGTPGSSNIEVILDIMMASYMAPGLSKILVYEGYYPNDVLNRMATDNLAQQLSSSWGFGPINATTEQIFKEYIAQGQSLLQASGDSGAYTNGVMAPSDDPNLTVVGGTSLTTAGAGGPWQSEQVWSGSGGGVSTVYSIPSYQQGLAMSANHGSTTMRNIPDVALTADIQMFLIQSNGQAVVVGGTSAAAPLWSGFVALANQQAAASGKTSLGFLNPLLYTIGEHSNYSTDLNDITHGSNGGFTAVSGYDLTTGWGSPAGQHLINDLTGAAGAGSFSISASAATLSLKPASSGSATLNVSRTNGFSGNVSLAVSGLPSGVTAALSPISSTGMSTLTLSASATATAGTSIVTVTGTSGALRSTTTVALTLTVPSFTLSLLDATLGLPRSSNATETVAVVGQNGFNGSVTLSVAGLPAGVTATFGTANASGTSLVTFVAGSTAALGSSPIVVNGVSGTLKSSASFTLTVLTPSTGSTLVNLAPVYNINALVTDGMPFNGGGLDGGLNGSPTAYSANLIGVQQTISGSLFYFGPANAPDAVSERTVTLPAGQYASIALLAAAVNGSQMGQAFKVTYTDGTSSTFTQNMSDWFTPQNFAGEVKAMTMAYRDTALGQKDNRTFYVYRYSFPLNTSKTVAGITLPNNRNVVVLAANLVNAAASVQPKQAHR